MKFEQWKCVAGLTRWLLLAAALGLSAGCSSDGGSAAASGGSGFGGSGGVNGGAWPGGAGGSGASGGSSAAGGSLATGGSGGNAGATDAGADANDSGPSACGCLLGEGPYCGGRAKAEADAAGCTIDVLQGHRKDLLKCENDKWSVLDDCSDTCNYDAASSELDDECELPVCDCFVQVAWCGSGAAKEAAQMGCRIPLLPEHNGDILYCPGGNWDVKTTCPQGCVEAPTGTPDYCKDNSEYRLPWKCGDSYRCSSGNHTSNHSGKDEYAYDFAVPFGTPVRAMRPGTVLRVRKVSVSGDSCYNGGGSACANYANTVEIKHADGTIGLYMHLSTISATQGAHVNRGDVIAKSGNSGWSTGPHLHVQVQSNCGIWWCQSQPFKFEEKANIATGTTVTSGNCP